jgi:hypothetical protein
MALGLSAVAHRTERRFGLLEPDSLLMILVYLPSLWALYQRATSQLGPPQRA